MFNQPISAVIPAGFGMIVEIVENSNNFGIGFTNSPQTATSYFYRPCDPSPSIREDLFGSHYIINAKGGPGQPITQTAGLPSGSVFPVGITTNIFKAGETTVCSFTITVVIDLTATIPDVKALSKGVEANTVYQGYTPTS